MSDDQISQDQHFAMDLVSAGQRQQTNERLEKIEQLLLAQQDSVVAKCPYCDGELSKIGVEVCKHCSRELLWYEGIVYKEGELEQAKIDFQAMQSKMAEEKRTYLLELHDEIERLEELIEGQIDATKFGFKLGFPTIIVGLCLTPVMASPGFGLILAFTGLVTIGLGFLVGFSNRMINDGWKAKQRIQIAKAKMRRS